MPAQTTSIAAKGPPISLADVDFACIHNGRMARLSFAEAHRLLWESSLGYVGPENWLRYQLGPYRHEHHLLGVVSDAGMQFGMPLMTRGRRALTLSAMKQIYPDLSYLDLRGFQARAAKFAKAFLGVPREHRPYKYLKVYGVGELPEGAYQMRPDVTWLLILDLASPEPPGGFDWSLFLIPPESDD